MKIAVLEHFSAQPSGAGHPGLRREGRALRDAVSADLRRLPGVEVLIVEHGRRFRETLRASHGALVIAPAGRGILETRCRQVEDEGRLLLGPSSSAVRLASDKLLAYRCLLEAGVPVPRTEAVSFAAADRRLRELTPPFVVKPRDGCGGQGVVLVQRRSAVEAAIASLRSATRRRDFLVQDYVEGHAASVSVLARDRVEPWERDAALALALNRQRSEWRDTFFYLGGETPWPHRLASRALEVARAAILALRCGAAGVRGYLGVDLVLGRAGATVIELNPRLTTAYLGLRRSLAGNLAELVLNAAAGQALPRRLTFAGRHRFGTDGTTKALPCLPPRSNGPAT